MSIEIKPREVIKLIQQFLQENGFYKALDALRDESSISLNVVDSIEELEAHILNARWDECLKIVVTLQMAPEVTMQLFELIIVDLLEMKEKETAQLLLKETLRANKLREQFQERCMKLDALANQPGPDLFTKHYPAGATKEKVRSQIAKLVCKEVSLVPKHRLLTLIGFAMKYQYKEGMIPADVEYDIFSGKVPHSGDLLEEIPTNCDKIIKLGSEARAEVAKFSPDGQYLAVGSVDGIIEIWDPHSGLVKTDLPYQAEEGFMIHNTTITALAWTKDSDYLASASKDGQLKIWKVVSGDCIKSFDNAHVKSISSILFSRESSHIISASKEIRVHGLKGGKLNKEFRGHEGIVNDLVQDHSGNRLASGASDGTVRIWDWKSQDCLLVFRPPNAKPGCDLDVFCLVPYPMMTDHFIICLRSTSLFLANFEGQMRRVFNNERNDVDFKYVTCSGKGKYIYGLTADGFNVCFDAYSAKIEHVYGLVSDKSREITAITHHPTKNILASYTIDGDFLLWKS